MYNFVNEESLRQFDQWLSVNELFDLECYGDRINQFEDGVMIVPPLLYSQEFRIENLPIVSIPVFQVPTTSTINIPAIEKSEPAKVTTATESTSTSQTSSHEEKKELPQTSQKPKNPRKQRDSLVLILTKILEDLSAKYDESRTDNFLIHLV